MTGARMSFDIAENSTPNNRVSNSTPNSRVSEGLRKKSRKSFADHYETTNTRMQGSRMTVINSAIIEEPGVSSAVFNLANTIMGASLTGLPFVVSHSGIIPYILFMSFSVFIGYNTICFLVESLDYVPMGKKDFQVVGTTAMGRTGSVLTALATTLSCYGALISYVVLTGIQGPFILELMGMIVKPAVVQITIAIVVLCPLCMLSDISALAPTSFIAIMVFAAVAITSVYNFATNDDFYLAEETKSQGYPPGSNQTLYGAQWFPNNIGWREFGQFPTILMAFNCQYAFLPIVEKFASDRKEDMRRVGFGGLISAYSTYIVLGVCAYLTYQGYTEDMILLNFRHCHPKCDACTSTEICNKEEFLKCEDGGAYKDCKDSNIFINILNGLFLFAVLMGYPCVHFACRKAQIALTFGLDSSFSWPVHCGFGALNVFLSLGVGLAVGSNVSVVFRWTGAVASPLLSFILPSAFYWQILGNNGVPFGDPQRLKVFAVLVYGCFIVLFCITCNLLAP